MNPQYAEVDLQTELVEIRIHCGQPSREIISGEELLMHQIRFG